MAKRRPTTVPDRAATQRLMTALSIQREETRAQAERWLDASAELESFAGWYLHLFRALPIPFLVLDAKGVIIELNPAAAAMLLVNEQRSSGKPLLAHVYRDDAKILFRHLRRCERDGTASSELRLRLGPRPIRLVSQRLTRKEFDVSHDDNNHSDNYYYYSVIWDISEDSRRDKMRRLSEARHREIIETANDGICIVDQENRITFANRRFAAMVGTSVEDMEGRSAYDFVPGSEVENARVTFERRDTGVGGQSEQRLQRLDGSTLVAGVSSTVRRDEQGRFIGMLRMYTDATMRQLLTEARETLMRELIATQERERQRIARELHDQMGQHIVALSLGLARLSSIEPGGSGAFAIIEQLRSVVEMLGRDVHTLALELRPSTLDHLGLCVALTSYAEETAARSDIEIDVHCDRLDDLKLSASVETGIYRIAQEALTNVVKHAQARRVSVILERRPTLLQLIIEDDGNGFDPSVRTGKLGVAGMRERAALLGGTVTVETSPGNGATVYARIPLEVPGSKDKNEQTPSFVAG